MAFLAIVFSGYYGLHYFHKSTFAKIWLVVASFFFYAQGSLTFTPFFVVTVFFNYGIGTGLHRLKKKKYRILLLSLGLIENIALLGYFKYANFFIDNMNAVFDLGWSNQKIILPIGISFFTFQLIAYVVDCYRGQTKEYRLLHYLLFITFFPQLIVGPIVHHAEVVPQFEDSSSHRWQRKNIALGLFILSVGCAKKVLLADPLTSFARVEFAAVGQMTATSSLFSSLAYTFSYYFDLSGYADMAIGMGLLFNIHLPQNFNAPYRARNFKDYWRRWHMSLSKFLSDYVFRSVYKKGSGSFRFYFAVMVTFFVSGFWHGAGWKFVLWGLINGVFVCMAHFMARRSWSFPAPIAWGLTFIGVVATRIIFVSKSFSDALVVMRKIFDWTAYQGWSKMAILQDYGHYIMDHLYVVLILLIAMCIAFFFKTTKQMTEDFELTPKYAIYAGILFGLSLLQMNVVVNFLYFQF